MKKIAVIAITLAVLVVGVLAAGCTSTTPQPEAPTAVPTTSGSNGSSIVGIWEDLNDPGFYYEFTADGIQGTYFIDEGGETFMENRPWKKFENESYAGYTNLYTVILDNNKQEIYSLSDDGNTITMVIFKNETLKSSNPTAKRITG